MINHLKLIFICSNDKVFSYDFLTDPVTYDTDKLKGFSITSNLRQLVREDIFYRVGLQDLGRKPMAKHLSDCVLHCFSDFFYLPTVKNRV